MKLFLSSIFCIITSLLLVTCKETPTPRPRAYFRIDLPEKEYKTYKSECDFSFQYPAYGEVEQSEFATDNSPCWYNIRFNDYKATIYLTYKSLDDELSVYTEDVRKIVYKHIIKADDIIESPIRNEDQDVYGILYDIKGNAASSLNFYITDSVSGFLSGSLYFNVTPNRDSLAPVIHFFREDIVHLINTFAWE
jgi:gliding motility-associated lipoprotein GldD